jgi:hypothetical protein
VNENILHGIILLLGGLVIAIAGIAAFFFMKNTDLQNDLEDEQIKNIESENEKIGLQARLQAEKQTVEEHRDRITALLRSGASTRGFRDKPEDGNGEG